MSFEASTSARSGNANKAEIDADLIRRHLQGDGHAFQTLYERHETYVLNILSRERLNSDEINDCAQECWIRVVRGLKTFENRARFDVWLYRIAANVMAEHGRDLQRHQRLATALSNRISPARRPEALQSTILRDLMKRLPVGMRMVLSLWIDGYRHSDIAGILGIAEGTSKSQLTKARRRYLELNRG